MPDFSLGGPVKRRDHRPGVYRWWCVVLGHRWWREAYEYPPRWSRDWTCRWCVDIPAPHCTDRFCRVGNS